MPKFKIEKGITPGKRGPKAKLADYEELFNLMPKMKSGESIKIVEVPESRRNSSYNSVNEILQKQLKTLKGNFYLGSKKLEDDKVEIRLYRMEDK
jgi:hypothetical protein